MYFAHLVLATAASFSSSNATPQLDYSLIKPKEQLIHELSMAEGIPIFDDWEGWLCRELVVKLNISTGNARKTVSFGKKLCSCMDFGYRIMENIGLVGIFQRESLVSWMKGVVKNGLPVSEAVARWAMFSCGDFREFFIYCLRSFGYVSLVKDLVDYGDVYGHLEVYFREFGLNQFPHLPASLHEFCHPTFVLRYALPLLSDYPVNHPRIGRIILNRLWSADELRFALICQSLGAAKPKPSPHRLGRFPLLSILDEVSRDLPGEMAESIEMLAEDDRNMLEIYQSGLPPSDRKWLDFVHQLNEISDLRSVIAVHSLSLGLIHHFHQCHPEWIRNQMRHLNDHIRTAYFVAFPQDTKYDLLPAQIPPFKVLIPNGYSADLPHLFEAFISKYGLRALREAAFKPNQILWDHERDQRRNTWLRLRICDPQYLEGATTFNQIITRLHYTMDRLAPWYEDRSQEYVGWLKYLLSKTEPILWSTFLLHCSNKE